MLNSINAVSQLNYASSVQPQESVNFRGKTTNATNTLERSPEGTDVFEAKKEGQRSLEEKQQIVKNARKQAAGWAILGGIFSPLYYGTKSDEKIAKTFDLDIEKDKNLIKQIRHDQTMWSLPGLLPGIGPLVGWIVAASRNSNKIEIN